MVTAISIPFEFRKYVLPALGGLMVLAMILHATGVAAAQAGPDCTMPFESVSLPLTDLGSDVYVRMDGTATGYTGGLYPGGSNIRPDEHELAGRQIAAGILPLNDRGEHDPLGGRIVLVSIGMSNTGQEFGAFQSLVHKNPRINPQLTLINGGVGGRTAEYWVDPASDAWDELQRRLDHFSISNEQVQVAWIKLTLVKGGEFPAKAIDLQEHLVEILQHLKDRFPNLKLAYLSSRTRSYTYWRGLSPEPVAFETGFAVKWLIQQQINGDPTLNYDPTTGDVLAPWLSWGPYLWADGLNARSDGLQWLAEDLTGDCTHPSESGKLKVANMLLEFFLNDTTTAWFRSGYSPYAQSSPVATILTQTPDMNSATIAPPAPTSPHTPEPVGTISGFNTSSPELLPAGDPDSREPEASPMRAIIPISVGAVLLISVCILLLRWKS